MAPGYMWRVPNPAMCSAPEEPSYFQRCLAHIHLSCTDDPCDMEAFELALAGSSVSMCRASAATLHSAFDPLCGYFSPHIVLFCCYRGAAGKLHSCHTFFFSTTILDSFTFISYFYLRLAVTRRAFLQPGARLVDVLDL